MRRADLHDGHDGLTQRRDAVAPQSAVHRGDVEHAAARRCRRRRLCGAPYLSCVRPGFRVPRQSVCGRDAQARGALRTGRRAPRARRRTGVDLPGRARDACQAARISARARLAVVRAAPALRLLRRLAARRRTEVSRRKRVWRRAAQRLRDDRKQPHRLPNDDRRTAHRLFCRPGHSWHRSAVRRYAGRT